MNKRYEIEQKVFSYLEKHQMIIPGDKLVIGVSGGADSVCLFFLLLAYKVQIPFEMTVVHVHHGIREDADLDGIYVEELCRKHKITYQFVKENVAEYARNEKCSEEDAGRRVRYQAFRECAGKMGGAKIAVAHNANDRAETMLLHLFRGSGLRGMCGIEPVRDDIIRPILCLERAEIEAYLKECNITWREDGTNQEDKYTRNKIRHKILPYAEEEIAACTVRHMCKTADLLSETESFMKQHTLNAKSSCMKGLSIDVEKFNQLHIVLQKRVILEALEEVSPTGKDISAVHIENVIKLFHSEGNKSVDLPFGIRMRRQYDVVLIERTLQIKRTAERRDEQLPELEVSVFEYTQCQEIPQNKYTKWFDYDKISILETGEFPTLRYRETGDFLTITDGKGKMIHKSLKDFMIAEKIPKDERDKIPVLAEGRHIIWLIGYRISEYYKVGQETKRILQLRQKERVNYTEEENG